MDYACCKIKRLELILPKIKKKKVINNFECLTTSGNKLLTTLKLIENKIPTPETYIAFKDQSAINAIEGIIGYPAIIKPIIGSWGRLIAKLDDYNSATANLECREIMGNIYQKMLIKKRSLSLFFLSQVIHISLLIIPFIIIMELQIIIILMTKLTQFFLLRKIFLQDQKF